MDDDADEDDKHAYTQENITDDDEKEKIIPRAKPMFKYISEQNKTTRNKIAPKPVQTAKKACVNCN